jgi:hypothetical protein
LIGLSGAAAELASLWVAMMPSQLFMDTRMGQMKTEIAARSNWKQDREVEEKIVEPRLRLRRFDWAPRLRYI